MAKLNSVFVKFWLNALEWAINSADFNYDWGSDDATDTSTTGDGIEITTKRPKGTTKIEYDLRDALGTELATGSPAVGQKCIVTGGTVTSGGVGYTVGMLFTATGVETLSGTNKCKPLGAKIHAENMTISIAASTTAITSFKYDEKYKEDDASDTATGSTGYESTPGRATRTSTVEIIMDKAVADLLTSTLPANKAVVVTLAANNTITGTVLFTKKGDSANSKGGDLIKATYDMTWQGQPTSTLNTLPTAVSYAAKRILYTGASTNKGQSGNGIIFNTSFEVNAQTGGLVKVSQDMTWQGVIAEAVAN